MNEREGEEPETLQKIYTYFLYKEIERKFTSVEHLCLHTHCRTNQRTDTETHKKIWWKQTMTHFLTYTGSKIKTHYVQNLSKKF